MHPAEREPYIRNRLTAALEPSRLEIVDESHKHAGHKSNVGGGGHFQVTVVSAAFAGKGLLQRHRMVYDALGNAMGGAIHALSIKALTPDEAD